MSLGKCTWLVPLTNRYQILHQFPADLNLKEHEFFFFLINNNTHTQVVGCKKNIYPPSPKLYEQFRNLKIVNAATTTFSQIRKSFPFSQDKSQWSSDVIIIIDSLPGWLDEWDSIASLLQ